MKQKLVMAILLVAVAAACKEKPKSDPAPAPVVPAQPVVAATPVNVNADVDSKGLDQVPVQEDFEDKARATITAENLETEIESLERETAE